MNLLKKIIKHLIIRGAIISSIFFPINRRKILFMSFLGKNYSDNPRSISDYLIKSCEGRFKIIWVYNSTDIVDDNIVFVRMGSIKYYFHLHTSKVIIANSLIFTPFYKRKNQYVINTWHSSMSIKKIQRDVWRDKDKFANKMKHEEVASKKVDLMISGSKVRTKTFRSAFSYSGPILEIGTPRNDIFFDENDQIIRMVKNEIGIDSDDKIVLFAPTFRDRKSENPIPFDTNKLLDNLSIKMSGKWKFVIKMHPADINSNYNFCSDIVNATKYNDMQALLYSSDILISDYSSLIFDFMLKKAPCFLFLNDYDSYTSNERELYIDVRTLPFPIAFSEDQLLQMISEFDSESYAKSIDVFMNEIESFERGYARKKILDIILNMTRK